MDDGQKIGKWENRIGKWEIVGFIVGCVAVLLSVTSLYLWDRDDLKYSVEIVPFALALNLVASVIFLCGIFLRETKFLLIALVWWTIPLTIWLIYLLLYMFLVNFFVDVDARYIYWKRYNLSIFSTIALPITVFAVIFYIAAVVCYIELKKENDRFLAGIAKFGILNKEPKHYDA